MGGGFGIFAKRRTTLLLAASVALICSTFTFRLHSDLISANGTNGMYDAVYGDSARGGKQRRRRNQITDDVEFRPGSEWEGAPVAVESRYDDDNPASETASNEEREVHYNGSRNDVRPPTSSPSSATWSPTYQYSWVPTYGTSSIYPTTADDKSDYGIARDEYGYFIHGASSGGHPRVACFIPDKNHYGGKSQSYSCSTFMKSYTPKTPKKKPKLSIPLNSTASRMEKSVVLEEDDEHAYIEDETCKYPDPDRRAKAIAPSTCNDVHSLGFDARMFEKNLDDRHHSRETVEYVTMGGAKCIWKVTMTNERDEIETVIFKSNKHSKFLKSQFWIQSNRDALISGGMGNTQLSSSMLKFQRHIGNGKLTTPAPSKDWNHILPLYQFCGLANIVPYASDGNLDEYIKNTQGKPRRDPVDTLRLALQAARGLYQAQMYWDGKPTFVHADLNPSQFLVFVPQNHSDSGRENNNKHSRPLPILQMNDFNQGRFLLRSIETNDTCLFQTAGCTKNQRGNRYHYPERFNECVHQDEKIDTFSLGGVFFYLLSNGFDPYYDKKSYMNRIKKGELPHIPTRLDLNHPAYEALTEVMMKCFAFNAKDRPSSLEVVLMLEGKLKEVGSATSR